MADASAFTSMILSLALERSMKFNSRRLETIGYAFSVLFFQYLIAGHEDIFLICPQFPVYVSPRDSANPDTTVPDAKAKGVYVDLALLMVHGSQRGGTLCRVELSEAFSQAYKDRSLWLYQYLDVIRLEVPVLEEKKRSPTRHPKDIEAYVAKLQDVLYAACEQVQNQASVLFASPRFEGQQLVIIIASSGEYYRLAVAHRDHPRFNIAPDSFTIQDLVDSHDKDIHDVVDGDVPDDADLSAQLSVGGTAKEREQNRRLAQKQAEEAETERQKNARHERARARTDRKNRYSELQGLALTKSKLIVEAGDPPYSDTIIEKFYQRQQQITASGYDWTQHPTFFEPEPPAHADIMTYADLRNPANSTEIIFTGVIRVGSKTSEKFIGLVRSHLQLIAQAERTRREQQI